MSRTIIVGGGIVGTTLAYYLGNRDEDVVVCERDSLGAGTTAASVGLFFWQQLHPAAHPHALRERAWEQYRPLVESEALGFDPTGALTVARTETFGETLETATDRLQEFGLEARLASVDEVASFGVDPDEVVTAMHTPEDGRLDPASVVEHFATGAEEHDRVELRTGVEVTDVETDGDRVVGVETNEGTLAADTVVNAAGPWVTEVNRMVGTSLPLRHARGPLLVFEPSQEPNIPFLLFEDDTYVSRFGKGRLCVGKLQKQYEQASVHDLDQPRTVDEAFRTTARDLLADVAPGEAELVDEWVGLRTVTPDGSPIVDEVGADGYFVAGGMSGLGVTLAPAVGTLLAERISTGSTPVELEELSADRFEGFDVR